jgi:hypothetical protein
VNLRPSGLKRSVLGVHLNQVCRPSVFGVYLSDKFKKVFFTLGFVDISSQRRSSERCQLAPRVILLTRTLKGRSESIFLCSRPDLNRLVSWHAHRNALSFKLREPNGPTTPSPLLLCRVPLALFFRRVPGDRRLWLSARRLGTIP